MCLLDDILVLPAVSALALRHDFGQFHGCFRRVPRFHRSPPAVTPAGLRLFLADLRAKLVEQDKLLG